MLVELYRSAPGCLRGVPSGRQEEVVGQVQGQEILDQEIMLLITEELRTAQKGH